VVFLRHPYVGAQHSSARHKLSESHDELLSADILAVGNYGVK
jgi:hypothetical protein